MFMFIVLDVIISLKVNVGDHSLLCFLYNTELLPFWFDLTPLWDTVLYRGKLAACDAWIPGFPICLTALYVLS